MTYRLALIVVSTLTLIANSTALGSSFSSRLDPGPATKWVSTPLSNNDLPAAQPFMQMSNGSVQFRMSTFRGIPRNQGDNLLFSNVLNRLDDLGAPYFIDVEDNFVRNGGLLGSDADTHQIGFVPPRQDAPWGPLMGQDELDHGRWSHGSDFTTFNSDGGHARRTSLAGDGIASTPWRAYPRLGDYYFVSMTADVAAGETVALGYLNDLDTTVVTQGFEGEVGQLHLEARRGSDNLEEEIRWTVSWDDEGVMRSFSSTVDVPVGETIELQLGWLEQGNNDLFDAWMGTADGDVRLVDGNMNTGIEVHEVGFFVSGSESSVYQFTAAVPEPSGFLAQLLGILSLLITRRPLW